MGWLVLCGLVNAHLLLWFGDVRYCYGLGGLVAFWLRKLPARYLALGVPLVALVTFVTTSQFNQHLLAVHQRYEGAEAAACRRQPLTAAQQQARAVSLQLETTYLALLLPDVLALLLLGIALFEWGFSRASGRGRATCTRRSGATAWACRWRSFPFIATTS
jgi:uncharacterized protein